MPGRVMTIIDGQQRLCTVVMANLALHDYISRQAVRLEGKTDAHLAWLNDEATKQLAALRSLALPWLGGSGPPPAVTRTGSGT